MMMKIIPIHERISNIITFSKECDVLKNKLQNTDDQTEYNRLFIYYLGITFMVYQYYCAWYNDVNITHGKGDSTKAYDAYKKVILNDDELIYLEKARIIRNDIIHGSPWNLAFVENSGIHYYLKDDEWVSIKLLIEFSCSAVNKIANNMSSQFS